ncbi:MAG: 6-phosphogluconolactonase [Myxococcota bacterium]
MATLNISPTAHDVTTAAHAHLLNVLRQALSARGTASVALSGGSTPQQLYARMAADSGGVDLRRVHWFWGDERAVPPDQVDSNYKMAWDTWLARSGIPEDHIHRMRGEVADVDAEAARYEELLEKTLGTPPALDVMLLGMGDDGHTLSLFPGTPATQEEQRSVVALHAGAPKHKRITMTAPAVRSAREVMVLMTGQGKAERLLEALEGPLKPQALPVQLGLRLHPHARLFCDEAAASRLARRS